MSTAILFKKCLGYNDAKALGTQIMKTDPRDPEAGNVELIDCLNLTTTPDSCLEKITLPIAVLTHSADITNISAGKRFLFQDGTDTWEWLGGVATNKRFPILDGPSVHTPIDCRVSSSNAVYKSSDASPAMQLATVGSNPGPETSKPFNAMPAFDGAFVYGPYLYAINREDPRFLNYSEGYHYDLWNRGDCFIGHAVAVLQAGQIPGVMLATHAEGVSVYVGTTKADFVKRFYPCALIDNTLYSGFISKIYGYSHVFLCDDGVYAVGPDGALVNLTVNQTDYVNSLNSEYYCATVKDGKYLAFGDRRCLEYDFKTKTLLLRNTFGIKSACVWNKVNYFATGQEITVDDGSDILSDVPCSMTLPFSTLGASGMKFFTDLYFTGRITGRAIFTATDNAGNGWSKEVADIGTVYNYRITTPRGWLGNHISIKIESDTGRFRMEELRGVFESSQKSK